MGWQDTPSEGSDPPYGGCVTCSDLATWMRVLDVDDARALAHCVDTEGRRETVDTGVVDSVRSGDSLLVHAGSALRRRAPGEAEAGD